MNTYGWQSAFIVTGALGFIWLVCWITMYEIPAKHKRIAKEELLYINSDAEPVAQVEFRGQTICHKTNMGIHIWQVTNRPHMVVLSFLAALLLLQHV